MLGDSDSQAILEKRPIKDLLGLNGFYEYLEVNWGILLSFFFFFVWVEILGNSSVPRNMPVRHRQWLSCFTTR